MDILSQLYQERKVSSQPIFSYLKTKQLDRLEVHICLFFHGFFKLDWS